MATNKSSQICSVSEMDAPIVQEVEVSEVQVVKDVKRKNNRKKRSGNFPKKQYQPIQDQKDYAKEADSFFRQMLEYKRLWGWRVKQERLEIDRMISLSAARRNAIRAIERGDVEAHDVKEILEKSEPEVIGMARNPRLPGVVDMGEAQSGCKDERPQSKKKNMHDKMYSTFTSLIFTSDANAGLTGNTTIQRQENARKRCLRLKNAAKTFIYFYTSHGFVPECDRFQQDFRDWESIFHIWYSNVIPVVKRCQQKLSDAKTQVGYNKAYKEANETLNSWIYKPFSFVEYMDVDAVEMDRRMQAYHFMQTVPLLSEKREAEPDVDMGEAQALMDQLAATTENEVIHMRTPTDKIHHMVKFIEASKVLLGDDCFGKGKIVFDNWQAQSDEYDMNKDWEEHDPYSQAEIRQQSNVVMVDDEVTTEAEQSRTGDAEAIPQSIKEVPNDIFSILTKPQKIRSFTWETSNAVGMDLMQNDAGAGTVLFPWFMMTPQETEKEGCNGQNWKYLLSIFGFFRPGLRFFVKLNTIRANAGMLRLVWIPMANSISPNREMWYTFGNYPHIDIDASVSNSAELVVPYSHFRDFFPLCDDMNVEYCSLGALMLLNWNPLMVGTGSMPNVSGTVWACFDNPEIHQPKWFTVNEQFFTNHKREPSVQPPSGLSFRVADLGDAQMEIAEGIAMLDKGAKVVEKVMQVAGNLVCDKPTSPAFPSKVGIQVVDPPVQSSGSDHSVRLGLDPLGHIKNGKQYRQCVTDQTNFPYLLDNYNRVSVVPVSTSSNIWDKFWSQPVTPNLCISWDMNDQHVARARPTTLAYISRMFGAWSGSLKYKFRAVVSDMHTVRFAIRYDPHTGNKDAVDTPDECSKEQSNIVIWDVAERKEIEVEIPFMSIRPVLRSGRYLQPQATADEGVGLGVNGMLSLFLYQGLRCPSIASPTIEVNISIAAGRDFKLWYLVGSNNILSIGGSPPKVLWKSNIPQAYKNASVLNYQHIFFVREFFKSIETPKEGSKYYNLVNLSYPKWLNAWQNVKRKWPVAASLRLNRSYVDYSEKKPYPRNHEALLTTDYLMPGTDGQQVVSMEQIYALLAGLGDFQMFYWYFDRKEAVQMPLKGDLWYNFDPRPFYDFTLRRVTAQDYKVDIMDAGEAQSGVAEVVQTDKDAKKPAPKKQAKAPLKVLPNRNPSSEVVKPIVLGKGRTLKTQDYVMGENWMNMRSVLKRFVMFRAQEIEPPFPDTGQITFCFPVTPVAAELDAYNFSVTPLSAIAKLYTFWRGSLRFKFVIPGVSGFLMKVAYHPFTANGYGAWNSDYRTEMDLSPCGEVIYSGNVMGSLEVEVPFASLYQRLNCAWYKDLTSMAGCVFVTVAIPSSFKDKFVLRSYHAIGEDFEFMIPREVPVVTLGPNEALIRLGDDQVLFPDGLSGISLNQQVRRHIRNGNVTLTQPYKTIGRDPIWQGMKAQSGDEDVKPSTSGFRSSNAEDDVNMIDDAVDGIIHAGKVVAEAAPRIEHSLASLVSVVSSLEKMSNLIPRVTDVVKKVGDAAEGIQEASYDVSKFFNLGRIGVVVMGVYTFLTAEDLTTRMIALGGVGLAIGVGPEVASNCVNWVMSTLGWEEPVWKVPQRKEYDAGTAQSLGELIQDHSTAFKWCAASTAVMVFFTLFGGYPKKDDVVDFSANWASKLKNFHFAGQAVRTADWLFHWVSDVIQGALTWAFNLEAGGYMTRKLLADKCGDILEWVDRINDLDTDEAMLQAIWDPNRQQDVWQLMDKGKELTELVTKNQKGGNLAVHINHGMRKLMTIEKKLCDSTACLPSRIDPFCLCLFGQAGVGKSSLLATLVNYVADGLGYAKTNRVYSRNSCDKYWSRYVGQPIVVEDDFAQNVDGDDVAEFINLKSNFGMNLNMGDLAEKGRPFTSHFIFQTTNNPFPKPTIISDRQALWRRRDMLVEVTGTKSDDFGKLRFNIIDPIHEHKRVIVRDINVEQLVNIVVYVASNHLDEQRKLVWRDLNRGLVVMPPLDSKGLSKWEEDVTKKAQTIIDLSHQAKEAGIPEPTPIKFKKRSVKIFDKTKIAKAKKVGEHSRGKWESQAEHDEDTDDDDIEDVLCAAGALKSMSTRMSVSDAQKKILATDTDIQKYIDEVYRYSNVRPSVETIKKAHKRLFNRCKDVSDELPIKKDIHDICQGLLNDCHSYSDKLWDNVKKENNVYVLKSEDEDVMLEWQLAEHELGEDEWQKVCNQRFNVPKVVKEEKFIIKRLKEAIESTKCWVKNWFNEHPRLFRAMKILCGFAGIFAGWKIVKWMMPEMCQKVETKIAEWFGIVSDSKPVCYIREKVSPVTCRARGIVNKVSKKIKNLLGYEVEEDDFKDLLDKALDNYSEDEISMAVESSTKEAIKKLASESKVYSISSSVRAPRSVHYGTAQFSMESQGTCDKQAENLVSKCVTRNLHRCKYELPSGKAAGVNVLALKGHCVLMPWHALETMEENQPVYFYRGGVTMTFLFDSSKVVRIGNTDAGIWNLGVKWPCAPDLSKHFIRESDLRVSRTMAELEILKSIDELDGETRVQSHIVEAEVMSQVEYNLPDKSRRQHQVGWVYKANTVPGDCGGVLVAFNPRMQRKLLGIHTAGRVDDSMGFSVLLSGEMLDKAISDLGEQFNGLPFVSQGAVYEEEAFTRCKVIPNGNFSLVGVMRDDLSVGVQARTSIKPSLLFDKVYQHKTEPAVQTPHDPRLEKPVSPMLMAINKYGNPTVPFHRGMIDYVAASIAWDIDNLSVVMDKRLLTLFEVIYGNDMIPFCDRMNMASSPGYPYILTRPAGEKGKAYLFDQDGIVDENLKNKYELRESMARSGKRCESVWVDSLKDERRTLEKIAQGKTRQFTIPPVDFTMLMRKYFMAFSVTFYANNIKFFSAVGIDPYSYQWTQLYYKLRKKSNLAIGGDFHAFDGIADPELYMRLCDIINNWYDDGPDNARVRKLLFHELIHTNHLCWNLLYFKHQGNPSGNPLTVIINTMMVVFYLRLTWLELSNQFDPQKASITDYRENVEEICYGDDFLITVKGEVVDWFNMLTITQALSYHKIELTDENKGSSGVVEPIRHLDEMKFLKNRFLEHPRDHSWKLAAISQDTIQELINWVRESDDPVQTLKENIHDSFRFSYFWGESFYDKHCSLVNDAMRNINIEPILMSWASWDSHFRSLRA